MKILNGQTIYRCDFCAKVLRRHKSMEKHEQRCSKNPGNNIACIGCVYLRTVKNPVINDKNLVIAYTKGFRCEKKDVIMYPPIVIHKGLLEKYPKHFVGHELMPLDCDLHSDKSLEFIRRRKHNENGKASNK